MKSGRISTSRPIRRRSFWPMPPTTSESYGGSNAENSAFMYLALKRAGIPAELHIYATGDHDFGVRQNEKLPSSWTQLCVNWLRSQGLLKPVEPSDRWIPGTATDPRAPTHAAGRVGSSPRSRLDIPSRKLVTQP